jgi:hypothetical protein
LWFFTLHKFVITAAVHLTIVLFHFLFGGLCRQTKDLIENHLHSKQFIR